MENSSLKDFLSVSSDHIINNPSVKDINQDILNRNKKENSDVKHNSDLNQHNNPKHNQIYSKNSSLFNYDLKTQLPQSHLIHSSIKKSRSKENQENLNTSEISESKKRKVEEIEISEVGKNLWFVPIRINFYSDNIDSQREKKDAENSDEDVLENNTENKLSTIPSISDKNSTDLAVNAFNQSNATSPLNDDFVDAKNVDSVLIELKPNEKTIRIPKHANIYKLNTESTGFYRVKYENHDMFEKLIHFKNLSPRDVLSLVNDCFQLTISTEMQISVALSIAKHFAKEHNSDVLFSVISGLAQFKSIFYENLSAKQIIENILKNLVKDRIKNIDLKTGGRNLNEISLNTYIIDAAVSNNHEETINMLNAIYDSYKNDNSIVHPVFRRSMFIS
ncbi:hypothetical protein EDEG_01715 [Edhazardia aedis USNM 41457]|uniref:ERAP1-like C-terminal domain-containing protein n=1 Tax=Edhazardia aedis (strain USNM 41457) TaxID=1003232 RepID=J9DRM9_EDHAE|nr:hypothetical protein EDEG_01715 [Edhazardia aedis USNM 41457]|eukprot:EJW03982.1 hypothetical protein EDEG_01715 [Edhazardia aedis USNM 41457]